MKKKFLCEFIKWGLDREAHRKKAQEILKEYKKTVIHEKNFFPKK